MMFRENNRPGKMMILGHRGSPREAPENTIPSFLTALERGADGIELDVTLSRDKALIIIHDYTLSRTTDGRGLAARRTLEQLKSLDAGSYFSRQFAGTRIPTLQEVIEALGRKAFIMIEIKTSLVGANMETADAVAAVVARHDLYKRVVVSSFNPFALVRTRKTDPHIPVGLLHFPLVPSLLQRGSFADMVRPAVLHPHHRLVNRKYMEQARMLGCRVIPWTVNAEEDLNRMMQMGVDGVITDYPGRIRKVLAKSKRGLFLFKDAERGERKECPQLN
ncbi:MAG: glycerophosphodiester phosphodiesterase [Firmicutes bacterium]|nr:glycerophosphodiester phosphodiesterase [Bacillota bacterium]